jgi:hypothetical protein
LPCAAKGITPKLPLPGTDLIASLLKDSGLAPDVPMEKSSL